MTWQDVAEVVMNSWPAGPGNKGWERDQLGGYVAELQERKLSPHWAIVGLRASTSAFIPSAGEVLGLAREAKGPPTAEEIMAAEQRFDADAAARSEAAIAAAYAALPKEIDGP